MRGNYNTTDVPDLRLKCYLRPTFYLNFDIWRYWYNNYNNFIHIQSFVNNSLHAVYI